MYAVRFHGRGGQGVKTASRILGTAAFVEGFIAQDSPIYGAERRGAPVAAFTRFSRTPIRERGVIGNPNLVVVADSTLLDDPVARVLEGVETHTAIFINTPLSSEQVRRDRRLPGRVLTLDLTGLALEHFGKRAALSALLGAVAGRLVGLRGDSVRQAVARELADLGLDAERIGQNQTLAEQCFEVVPTVTLEESCPRQPSPVELWNPTYEPPTKGTAMIASAANVALRKTGGWRTLRPVLEADKCNGCFLCFVYCPEGAIRMGENERPVIDYDHCKGCLLCVEECPTHALVTERETEATGKT